MQMSIKGLIPLLLICVVISCNEYSFDVDSELADSPALITVKDDSLSLPADDALTCDPEIGISEQVLDTLWIDSNRSWSINIPEECSHWLSVSLDEYVNVTGETQSFPLVVSALRHHETLSRTAEITIFASGCDPIILPVEQKAFQPTLLLEALSPGEPLAYAADTCFLVVRSNLDWEIAVDSENSSGVTLSKSKGTDVKVVEARFPYNFDDERGRSETVAVSSSGMEKSTYEIFQRQSETFFRLVNWTDGIQNPLLPKIHIPLESNSDWTAEIISTTYQNARLEPSSGSATVDGLDFIADHGFDPEIAEKQATIAIQREGKSDIIVNFTQEGCIHLKFLTYNPDYNEKYTDSTASYMPYQPYEWMWTSHDEETFPIAAATREFADMEVDLVMNGGYVFTAYGRTNGIWYRSRKEGLQIGKSLNDYIKFPAVDGKRLSRMLFESSALAPTTYTVRTEDGTEIIEGGEKTTTTEYSMIYQEYNDVKEAYFPATETGTRYRLNLESSGSCLSIKELCLFYE